MDRLLSSLSKPILVGLLLVGGLIFIVFLQPPHSICDTQIELFRQRLEGQLFSKTEKNVERKARFAGLLERCKTSNTPGGCFELFHLFRLVYQELLKIPRDCSDQVSQINEVSFVVLQVPELLSRIAWGEEPPNSYLEKYGWLENSDMALFCDFKRLIVTYYGAQKWNEIQEKMFATLPKANTMDRQKIWDRMLFSSRCEQWQ